MTHPSISARKLWHVWKVHPTPSCLLLRTNFSVHGPASGFRSIFSLLLVQGFVGYSILLPALVMSPTFPYVSATFRTLHCTDFHVNLVIYGCRVLHLIEHHSNRTPPLQPLWSRSKSNDPRPAQAYDFWNRMFNLAAPLPSDDVVGVWGPKAHSAVVVDVYKQTRPTDAPSRQRLGSTNSMYLGVRPATSVVKPRGRDSVCTYLTSPNQSSPFYIGAYGSMPGEERVQDNLLMRIL